MAWKCRREDDMERLKRIPVAVLPTLVGALTLSNVYDGMGYAWVRHLTMWTATVVLVCYFIKIICCFDTCKEEYKTTLSSCLYGGLTMVMMILGSYYFDYSRAVGKGLFVVGFCLQIVHILVFTYNNVIRKRDIHTFVPSWFVTYNGFMVCCVVGGVMNMDGVLRVVVYYGIVIYFILISFLIWRLLKVEIKSSVYHTMAVVLSPCSLCVVSYLNLIDHKAEPLLWILYACVLASLLFVIIKLPRFFAFSFSPAFASLTFPMAIGVVATSKMTDYLTQTGRDSLAAITRQLGGIQLYLTTMIIGYVLLNFLIMALGIERKITQYSA